MSQFSLRTRVAAAAALAAAVVLVIAGILIVRLTERDERLVLNKQLAQQATTLARPLARLAGSRIGPLIQRAALSEVDSGRTVRVLSRAGQLQLSLGVALPSAPGLLQVGRSSLRLDGAKFTAYAVDVRGDQVQVIAPLEPLQAQANSIRRRVITVGLGAVVATSLIAYFATGAALASLYRLRNRVEGVAATQDLTQRMPADGPPEVAEVGNAFNKLLDRLQRTSSEREQALGTARAFAADAAHELRTPLTSMAANLSLLSDADETIADPSIVTALTEDHARLVGALEALHSLTLGELNPAGAESVDLADLLVLIGNDSTRHPGLAINVEVPAEPVMVTGDREALRMLFDNLLTNAERHSQSGDVHIGVVKIEPNWLITVDDNGAGWPENVARQDLLDRFTRGPNAGPGSGLGLAIAAQQARRHGGTLTLSDVRGGGARVEVTLPVA